ncbi:MAG: NitT/TauT family transport system permease protein [Betaproteobacteria bacterium]|jgi:ABC-type nitrate/sulfonate/bicarbonate transport system permease component|nr:NitT/TauT family transport system permease protein [Betaproteobacteria bacterium]
MPPLRRLAPVALSLVVLALWQLAALHGLPQYVLGPFEILRYFVEALGTRELYDHIGASLMRSVPGFVLGSLAGVALGLAAGVSRALDQTLSPAVFLSYPVPKIVMLPIFMLWFGIGDFSKILVIALACFYPMFINAYTGARTTPGILVWSAQNMGAGRWRIFRRVVLPAAMPMIFAGLRVALALSFIVMFAAEMINASSGLGHLIRAAESGLRFDLMYVSLLSIAILGYAGDRLLRLASGRVLVWQEGRTA